MINRFLLYFFLTASVTSCNNRRQHIAIIPISDSIKMEFARGFTMEKSGDITLLTVYNPWQDAQNIVYRYALCPKGVKIPAEFSQYTVIQTPVERVVCLATTHVAMLSALGQSSSIKALSGTAFVINSTIRGAIDKGEIVDIGYEHSLNYEKIISLNPDVIFAYGVGSEQAGRLAQIAQIGQKVVFNADYLERTPLGKTEWIKFMAAFYNYETQAVEKFDSIRDEYFSLCRLVDGKDQKPKILCGLPWQGIWYIPGGETWMTAMIADAGGDYIWKENTSHESIPISIEAIVNLGSTADIWINTGAARSLAEIRLVDERLPILKPLQIGAVYNNNARMGVTGGNDFFESGTINPHIILKDMIKIFHPDLLLDYDLHYYLKLK